MASCTVSFFLFLKKIFFPFFGYNLRTNPYKKARRLRAITFAIEKLEDRKLYGEQYITVEYCYCNIERIIYKENQTLYRLWGHQ